MYGTAEHPYTTFSAHQSRSRMLDLSASELEPPRTAVSPSQAEVPEDEEDYTGTEPAAGGHTCLSAPHGRWVRAAGLLLLGSPSNGGRLHSQLLPPLALLVFYRSVSMLQTSKYSTAFLGWEYRFPVPHQNVDLPPASGTPLGHPLSFGGPPAPGSASRPSP